MSQQRTATWTGPVLTPPPSPSRPAHQVKAHTPSGHHLPFFLLDASTLRSRQAARHGGDPGVGSRCGRRRRRQRRWGRRRARRGLGRDDPGAAAPRRRAWRKGRIDAARDPGPAPPGAPATRRAAAAAPSRALPRLLRSPRPPAQRTLLHQGAGSESLAVSSFSTFLTFIQVFLIIVNRGIVVLKLSSHSPFDLLRSAIVGSGSGRCLKDSFAKDLTLKMHILMFVYVGSVMRRY